MVQVNGKERQPMKEWARGIRWSSNKPSKLYNPRR